MKNKKNGFTLVELVVVIGILSIFAGLAAGLVCIVIGIVHIP